MTISKLSLFAGTMLLAATNAFAIIPPPPVFTLQPLGGAIAGPPGSTIGWGFTIANAAAYIEITSAQFCLGSSGVSTPCVLPVTGVFTDFISGFNDIIVGPPPESPVVSQSFNNATHKGVGSFTINPGATPGQQDIGQIVLTYNLFLKSPNDPTFNPGTDTLATDLTVTAPASVTVTADVFASADAYQVGYAANLVSGDSYVNITNTGVRNGFDPAGGICVNVYAFDPSEELVSCCSCYVTPDGLKSVSVKQDLLTNTLTPGVPGSVVIKLLASVPGTGSSCNASLPTAATLEAGARAWGTSLHQNTSNGNFEITENVFQSSVLSTSELAKLSSYCGFIQANGSGFGICKSCRLGGLGGAQR